MVFVCDSISGGLCDQRPPLRELLERPRATLAFAESMIDLASKLYGVEKEPGNTSGFENARQRCRVGTTPRMEQCNMLRSG